MKDQLVPQSHIPPARGDTVPVVHGQPVRTKIAYPLPPGPASGQHLTGVVATGPAPAHTLGERRNSLSPCGWYIRLWRERVGVRGINPRRIAWMGLPGCKAMRGAGHRLKAVLCRVLRRIERRKPTGRTWSPAFAAPCARRPRQCRRAASSACGLRRRSRRWAV